MSINNTFELNSTYACPICNNIVRRAKSEKLILRCCNCNNIFEAIDLGHVDGTNTYKLVHVGEDNNE